MRERAHQLKGEVRRRMFDAGGEATRSVADMVTLVDTLQRLGIDNHFRQEVDAALKRINSCESLDDGLQIVALRFRLLRQHGVWVPGIRRRNNTYKCVVYRFSFVPCLCSKRI